MLRVYHLQTVKQLIKGADIAVVVLSYFACPQSSMTIGNSARPGALRISDKKSAKEQHTRRSVPERVLGLAALWRGRFEKVGH